MVGASGIGAALEGIGASVYINAGKAAQFFTEYMLSEQGIAVTAGAGGLSLAEREFGFLASAGTSVTNSVVASGTKYAGHTAPGRYAGESIAAKGAGYASKKVRQLLRLIMDETGCHTCGTKVAGTKTGLPIGDHQPPNALNGSGGPQRFFPQCAHCSPDQGNEVKKNKE
jgi:hypothetical protein